MSRLTVLYNDNSVLENHHTSVGFSIMTLEGCDAIPLALEMEGQSQKWQTFRRIVIDLILATDMSKHMKLLADMKTMVESKSKLNLSLNHTDRVQVLQTLVHCADLSNPCKSTDLYSFWLDSVQQEFFEQGDLEKKMGLEISPMCNRDTDSSIVAQNQIGFIDYIVFPLWEAWSELVFPDGQNILEYFRGGCQCPLRWSVNFFFWEILFYATPFLPSGAQPLLARGSDRQHRQRGRDQNQRKNQAESRRPQKDHVLQPDHVN